MSRWAFLGVGILLVGCAGGEASPGSVDVPAAPTEQNVIAAAEKLCPVVWEWITAMGESFNDASLAMSGIDAPADRRARWGQALDEMVALDRGLGEAVEPMREDRLLNGLAEATREGVERSLIEIEDIRMMIESTPEIDEGRHQTRTAQLVVRMEKVIDVVKPRLLDDPAGADLMAGFQQIPSCQHAIKDVDDGSARFNG